MNGVQDGSWVTVPCERRLKLEHAARIARRDDVGSQRRNEIGFAVADGVGCIGLNEIVNSRRAAADGGFRDFGELQIWNFC